MVDVKILNGFLAYKNHQIKLTDIEGYRAFYAQGWNYSLSLLQYPSPSVEIILKSGKTILIESNDKSEIVQVENTLKNNRIDNIFLTKVDTFAFIIAACGGSFSYILGNILDSHGMITASITLVFIIYIAHTIICIRNRLL